MVDGAVCSSGVVVDPSAYRRPRLFHSSCDSRFAVFNTRFGSLAQQLANSATSSLSLYRPLSLSRVVYSRLIEYTIDISILLCIYIHTYIYIACIVLRPFFLTKDFTGVDMVTGCLDENSYIRVLLLIERYFFFFFLMFNVCVCVCVCFNEFCSFNWFILNFLIITIEGSVG